MTKWEYKLAWLLEPCAEEPTLNKLGAEGWELIAYDFDDDMGIFKRPSRTAILEEMSIMSAHAEVARTKADDPRD